MHKLSMFALAIASLAISASHGLATTPTAEEIARAHQWSLARFGDADTPPTAEPPFSFTYGDKPSAECLKAWKAERTTRKLDEARTERVVTYADPATGLVVTCRAVEYRDFPTVEWTLFFKNTGTANTPILGIIRPMDVSIVRPDGEEYVLHHTPGDTTTPESYVPLELKLEPNSAPEFLPEGRPTSGAFPYWNVAMPGGGMIAVLGWPGKWSARFERDGGNTLRILAGQEITHFTLRPGEEVRSPLAVVQLHDGDWLRAQNIWRRWMVAHNLPRPGGKLVPTHYAACFANLQPVAAEETGSIDGLAREGIKLDYWILDAGWYKDNGGWWNTGTWEIDRDRFPKGLREVSDHAHAAGMEFIVWFEPERLVAGSWLAENHPEWVLGGKNGGLLNLGNPDAWNWVVNFVDKTMIDEGIDVYRQDYNINPVDYWRANDAEDRQGITEIKYVTGYLAFWDELVRRDPKRWIDSCASGGRRNDLETLRRGVPLLRSDCFTGATVQQSQTYGLALWVPYFGSGTGMTDEYMYRSCIFPASRVGCDARDPNLDYALLKRMVAEFRKVQPYLLCDYHPLTPYSLAPNVWMAWQFDSPEQSGGFVQAFRREECPADTLVLKLRGLDPSAMYALEDLSADTTVEVSGKSLMDEGLSVKLASAPGSALYVYRKVARPAE
ncbi:MAG: alpha-galactosidase [Pirellulales bacterium]|nr:alpha-galactosidase [Pirellulales bacterium]